MKLGCCIENNPKITKVMTVYLRDFDGDFRFRGETHNFFELVCVCEGKISVAADAKIFQLTKGQAILHNPMQFHSFSVEGNKQAKVAVFSFLGENIPYIQDRVCEIRDISMVKSLVRLAQKHFLFEGLANIIEPKANDFSHIIYVKKLELFLLELASNLTQSNQALSQSAKNYSLIVNTMNDNVNKRLSVCELAELCNMSEINLQKTFSRYAGVGVMEYFNRIKMGLAADYLKEGRSVKETALLLGFQDQNYFSTAFKRITGHPPTRKS